MRTEETAPKHTFMPERLLLLLKQPGEAMTAAAALFAAMLSGGAYRAYMSSEVSLAGVLAPAVAGLLGICVIYAFRYLMKKLDTQSAVAIETEKSEVVIHTADTAANIEFVRAQNATIEILKRSEIDLKVWFENLVHAERRVKHDLDGALGQAVLSTFLVHERIVAIVELINTLPSDTDVPGLNTLVTLLKHRASTIYNNHTFTPEALDEKAKSIKRVPDVPAFDPRKSLDS